MSATVLFLSNGFDIYRKPVAELCSRAPDLVARTAEMAATFDVNPADICWSRDLPPDRPLVINWQNHPRPYPPGHLIYFLPEALAYKHLGAGFRTVNAFTIAKLTVVAHLAFVMVTLLLADFRPRGVTYFLGGLTYVQLISFALVGIYDALPLLLIFQAMLLSRRNRPDQALFALCAAFFFHFRVIWLAPFGVYLLVRAYRDRHVFQPGSPAAWVRVALTTFCLVSATAAFWILLPAMNRFPTENALYVEELTVNGALPMTYFAITLLVALLLASHRRWLAVANIAWCSFLFVWTPQIQPWHSLMLLPILLLPALDEENNARLESALALLFWFLMTLPLVFRTDLRPQWLAAVFSRMAGS